MAEQNAMVELSACYNVLRVLIVDDEPIARARLAHLCESRTDVEVVAQADSGARAIDAIRTHRPDVVLLDVELQDMSGFDVLRSFTAREQPRAIMITAHAEHALAAFESDAVDYLTKPVDANRFGHAIDRVRARYAAPTPHVQREIAAEVCAILSGAMKQGSVPLRLAAERARRLYFIETTDIEHIECDGNYVNIHTGQDQYIARNTLQRLTEMLQPVGFVRIQRSVLVNLRSVAFAERIGKGCYAFTLRSGKRLVSTAPYRRAILDEIRQRPASDPQ